MSSRGERGSLSATSIGPPGRNRRRPASSRACPSPARPPRPVSWRTPPRRPVTMSGSRSPTTGVQHGSSQRFRGNSHSPLDGLDCVNANTCVSLAQSTTGSDVFVMTVDGGQTWTSIPGPANLPSSFVFSDVSCATTTTCVAVGFGNNGPASVGLAAITTDGGQNWSDVDLPNGFVPMNDRCSAGGDCIAIGDAGSGSGAALYSQDGGSTWQPASLPAGVGTLGSISCGDTSHCLATAATANGPAPGDLLSSTDGGKSWGTLATGGVPTSLLMGVSCASASFCWVSGAVVPSEIPWASGFAIPVGSAQVQGLLATTQDGGQSWQTVQPSPSLDIGVVPAVSCPHPDLMFRPWIPTAPHPGREPLSSCRTRVRTFTGQVPGMRGDCSCPDPGEMSTV